MKILLIGGSGLIGSKVVQKLGAHGHHWLRSFKERAAHFSRASSSAFLLATFSAPLLHVALVRVNHRQ